MDDTSISADAAAAAPSAVGCLTVLSILGSSGLSIPRRLELNVLDLYRTLFPGRGAPGGSLLGSSKMTWITN